MIKRLAALAALLLLLLLTAAQGLFAEQPACHDDSYVFGPAFYQRRPGKPQTQISTFTSSVTGTGFVLRVKNGDHHGGHMVTSGSVTLNGVMILGPGDFNRYDQWIERPVEVLASNRLAVRLEGRPGSFITVAIVRGEAPPTVSFSASPEAIARGASATITWSTSHAETCSIAPGIGTVSLTGSVTVTPTETTTYTLTAVGAGGTSSATATVSLLNSPPRAVPDSATTNEDAPIVIDVLANDSDADGDSLVLVSLTAAAHGTVVITSEARVSYTPATNFNGSDGFTYTVSDGRGATATAPVSVTVQPVNDPPVANGQSLTTREDTPLAVVLTGSDPDGDSLNFVLVTPPSHGVLSGTPPNVTYAPSTGYDGPDAFTFKVNDGHIDSPPATVTITVEAVNHPPVANGQSLSTHQNTPLAVVLAGSDPDGDTLSFAVVALPSNGVLTGIPPAMTYTPNAGYHGADAFTFKVSDGHLESLPATVTITVEAGNHPPVAVDDSAVTNAGTPIEIAILANDSDPDDDALQVTSFTQPAHGTVTAGVNHIVSYTPDSGFDGTNSFTYTVSDGNGGTAVATVTVKVQALSSISLHITSPLEGERIPRAFTLVTGTVTNTSANETGVVVNGMPATVSGADFGVNEIRLHDGQNIISVVATDIEGNTASKSIVVICDTSDDYLRLAAIPSTGVAPMETTLLRSSHPELSEFSWSYSGPAEVEYLQSTNPAEQRVRLTTAGLYVFSMEALDPENNSYSARVAVVVLSREDLDQLLRAKWEGMKQKLQVGATEEALAYFQEGTQERYRTAFTDLADELPQIAAETQDIYMIQCRDRSVRYRIDRTHSMDGELVTVTYYIDFTMDSKGLGKLLAF